MKMDSKGIDVDMPKVRSGLSSLKSLCIDDIEFLDSTIQNYFNSHFEGNIVIILNEVYHIRNLE